MNCRFRSIFFGFLSICAAPANGQDPAWIRQHRLTNPDRVEGVYEELNAQSEYDVLAFQVDDPAITLQTRRSGHVTVAVNYCAKPEDHVFIDVTQLTGLDHYLMRASPPAQHVRLQQFAWPSKDVIDLADIDLRTLGVVVRLGEEGENSEELAPASLVIKAPQESAKWTASDRYALTLRLQRAAVDYLSYSITVGTNTRTCFYVSDSSSGCLQERPRRPPIEEGSTVHLSLDLAGMPEGVALVHIIGGYHNTDRKLTSNLRFQHMRTCH